MADAVSLHDELSGAIDAIEAQNDTSTAATEGVAGTGEAAATEGQTDAARVDDTSARSAAERARDEKGRFAKAQAAEAAAADPAIAASAQTGKAAQTTEAQAAQVDLPPDTWRPEAKAEYAHLSPSIRAEIKKREADFQKGISQYKQLSEHGNSLMSAINPYMPMIQSEGGDPVKAVTTLLNTAYRLRTGTPAERGQMIMAVAQQYGADLSQWMQPPQVAQGADGQAAGINPAALQQYIDQVVAQRTAPLQQIHQSHLAAQQQQERQATQATQSQIEQFRTAVDEKGQPAHIYFDNVRPLMASLIESGSAKTLDEAYSIACRAHPEVAKALDAERRLGDNAKRLEEARKKADDARRAAAANVTGQGGIGMSDSSKQSLRDELAAQYDRTASV